VIENGMPVVGRDGKRIGYVARVIDGRLPLPPGLTVALHRRFGWRRRSITLTSFDVRDVRNGNLILRLTRWDANNRWEQTAGRC
jgi:hypothetical protein